MPTVQANGITLAYEEAGTGFPLIWCHEFAGSMESWLPQVHFFSRRYRVITFNARGYPPSEVPSDPAAYSQDIAVEDVRGLMDALGIQQAYVGGLSMGGSTALHFGRVYPQRARALIVAGAGTGSTDPELFRRQCEERARGLEENGMASLEGYAAGPARVQLQRKDPAGWEEFRRLLYTHSPLGSALTMRGVQAGRPPIFAWEEELRRMSLPVLILVGDEDEPCLEPGLFLKRCLSRSGLVVFPQSGHGINLEEPDLFNRAVLDFLTAVEADRWPARSEGSGIGFMAKSG